MNKEKGVKIEGYNMTLIVKGGKLYDISDKAIYLVDCFEMYDDSEGMSALLKHHRDAEVFSEALNRHVIYNEVKGRFQVIRRPLFRVSMRGGLPAHYESYSFKGALKERLRCKGGTFRITFS